MFVLTSPFLDGWLVEFRPVRATDLLAADPDDRALLDFDLRLWRGALPENVRRHRVTYWWRAILAEPELDAEGREGHPIRRRLFGEMALCGKYARDPRCAGCPLGDRQGAPCGRQPDEGDAHERCARDPWPMVEALAACRAALDERPARGARPPRPTVRLVVEVEAGEVRAVRADPPEAVEALLVEYGESPYAVAVAGDGGVTERAAAWGQPVAPLTRERRALFS